VTMRTAFMVWLFLCSLVWLISSVVLKCGWVPA